MALVRKIVVEGRDRGRKITVRHMGPDLLCYVDDSELSGFFIDAASARLAASKYIDGQIKEQEKRK